MKKSPTLWILGKVKRRIPGVVLMTLSHVAHAVFGVLVALASRRVVDSAVSGDKSTFILACIEAAVFIAGIILTLALYRHLHDKLHAELDRDLKKRLLTAVLSGEYSAVSKYHSGEIVNRMNGDVRTVSDGLLSAIPQLAGMTTKLAAAAGVLIAVAPEFSAVAICAGVVICVITAFMRRRMKALHKDVSEADGEVSSYMQESAEKLLVIQAMDVSGEITRRADVLLDKRFDKQRKRKNFSLACNTGLSILSNGASLLALLWCATELLMGTMSFGSLTAITQLATQLQSPFVNLSGLVPRIFAMSASAERIMELEELGRKEEELRDCEKLYAEADSISADSLSFSYSEGDAVIDKLSFNIPKSAFCAVVGRSGVGKSTLLKLMTGVFSADSGELYVRCGGEKFCLDRTTRGLFAYVPQGNMLFSGTLRENLLIAKPDATEAELSTAIYTAAVDEFIDTLPDRADTYVGESGAFLSEGQAQRVAIARAILGGAPVLLLDEATSALDAQTEETVLSRIRALGDRTCIAVTHRPAAADMADMKLDMTDASCTETV